MTIGDLTPMEKMEVFLHMMPTPLEREDFETEMEIFKGSGLLVRQAKIPAGLAVLGEVHREFNVSILTSGKMMLTNDPLDKTKQVIIEGPQVFESAPLSQKFVITLTDCVFMNIMKVKDNETKDEAFSRMIIDTKELK